MTDERLTIRRATVEDAGIVAEHRARMFLDMGRMEGERALAMIEQVRRMAQTMLASGEYLGWFVTAEDGAVVAGAGVQMRTLLPRPETAVTPEALVVNVYVDPDYRRRGLARRLMEAILAWSQEQGIERVSLHASSMGRPLYESLGFNATSEMVMYLN